MSVQSATTRNDYTAGASQTVYAYTFEIKAASDITVIVGGVTKSLNTDYTVSGVGTNSGGNVTLSAAPASGTTVSLVMEMDLARDTDYQANGAFLADDVNNDFDSLWLATNQQETELGRSLRLNQTEPTSDMTLPLKDARKGSVLAFNETTGLPVAGPTIANVDSVAGITGDIATVADNDANITTVAGISGNVTSVANISANVTTVAGNTTNINAVAADASDIGTVASNISNVNTTAGISSDVTTVAGNNVNITTVAGDSSEITTVAGVASDVSTVSGIASDVTAVAGDASDIGTVASSISNVNAVGTNITNVNNVAGNASNINTVAADGTDIGTVAGISANVTTVAGISSDVTTVAGLETKMDTVIADASDIGTVAGISANVTTVADNSSNVTTVAGLETKMDTIIADASDIGAVATNINSVTTVSGISGDVTTVASKASDVETVADNIGDVQAASQNATNAAASAQAAASSASTAGTHATNASASANQAANSATGADDSEAAAGISASAASSSASAASSSASSAASSASDANDSQAAAALSASGASVSASAAAVSAGNSETAAATWNNFYTTYLGAAASAPSTDLLGQPLQDGALYFNTTDDTMYVFNGSIWIAAESTINIVSVPTQLAADLTTNGNDIIFGDNDKATFGASDDLQIYHDGSNTYIAESNATGNLFIKGTHILLQNSTGQDAITLINGDAYIKSGGQTKLQTTSTGIDVTGTVTADGVQVGNTSDAYSAVFITTSPTGESELRMGDTDTDAGSIAYTNSDDTMTFRAAAGARMTLDSTGIDINGQATMDGLTLLDGAAVFRNLDDTPVQLIAGTAGDKEALTFERNGGAVKGSIEYQQSPLGFNIGTDTGHAFRLKTGGTQRLNIASNGDISFYEDTGTTAKFFWDASAESLGLGTTSPDGDLDVRGAGLADLVVRATSANSTSRLLMRNDAQSFALRINGDDKFRIKDETADADRLVVDTSGRVGIGTSSPSQKLDIIDAGTTRAFIKNTNLTSSGMYIGEDSNGQQMLGLGAYPMRFGTNGAERMRIDSSGHLLVGSTSAANASAGFRAYSGGNGAFTSSATSLSLNRLSSDGEILSFQKDTTSVGSIGTGNGGNLYIGSGDAGINFNPDVNCIYPINAGNAGGSDGVLDLGLSGVYRFKDLHLSDTVYAGVRVCIGTTETPRPLTVNGLAGFRNSTTGFATSDGFDIGVGGSDAYIVQRENANIIIETNGSEAARIDSSGNLLVGTTSASGASAPDNSSTASDAGARVSPTGFIGLGANQAPSAYFNRIGNDGDIALFRKDGTGVGSIGSDNSGSDLVIDATRYTNRAGLRFRDSALIPRQNSADADAVVDLGRSTTRFKDLYLSGNVNLGGDSVASNINVLGDVFALDVDSNGNSGGTPSIQFKQGGSEKMRLSGGNLLVGTTSTVSSSNMYLAFASGRGFGIEDTSAGSGTQAIWFRSGTTQVGSISTTTTATSYNTSSDQRLKENIADADDAGSKIDAIQVRKYDWKADGSHQDYGMIAQELLEVVPEAVSVPEDSEEMMGVDYSKLVPMLIKEIQSLRNRVAQLEE